MHQVSSRLSKLALSVMLAFALVPTASVAAMADPQISDPASDPVIQSPSIDQGVSEEAPASTESWQGEGSEPAEADETAQPDSEAEASAAALAPDRQPVGFVYFDESSPSAGGSQLVVVALDDESIELTSAELTLTAPSGASVKATASEYAGNAALFSVDVPEAGEYRLERMEGASAADSRTLLVDLSSCEGEPYAFMVAEPQAEAFSLSDESTGGVSVYALTDDGQLEEASSFEEAAQLSAEAAPAVVGRSAASGARSPSGKFVVALDPGHGGSEPGASANGLVERELTWKIALYCKEALESYANVEVVLTRGSDEKVSLVERVNRAVDAGANVFVSLHLNSGPASGNGAEVWYPNDSSYRHELHEEGAQLSSKILEKLTALGLTDRGIKVRDSERVDGEGPFYYPDGSIQDYYTVIEASREAGIVGIIVEHAFLSNKSDSDKLKSEAFLKELGYADAEGIAETYKLSSGWEIDNGRWKLKLADGTYATSSWQQVKGKKYWFGADSYAVTGWQTIDEKRYYFDSSCALRTDGWLKDDGSWYWLSSSGVMQTGWLKLGGTWYWLDPQTGKMATGWTTASDGHRYYFDGSGAMQTGWAKVGGTWYYLSGSGAMQTGWLSKGGSWYWLDPDSGAMATGWAKAAGRQVVLLRRLRRHALRRLDEAGRHLVLPVRLRRDADRLAEQGRLLVLARPREREDGHRLGEGIGRQVVLLRRLRRHALRRLDEAGGLVVLPVRLRGDADGLAEQGRLLVLAGPREREDGHGLGEGLGRQVVLLRRLRRHALRRLDEAGIFLVLPVRLRGDADGLAEQGRLLVLAGPREREDGHGLGEGIGRQVVLLRRLGRHALRRLDEAGWHLVLPERIGSHAHRLARFGR